MKQTAAKNVTCGMCLGKCDALAERCPHCGYSPNDALAPPRSHRVPSFWTDLLGKSDCPYIRRYVLDLGLFSIRLHRWYDDDDQRALHDHPWWFATLILWGSYTDVTAHDYVDPGNGSGCVYVLPGDIGLLCYQRKADHPIESHDILKPGSFRFRPAKWSHTVRTKGCVSLLVTGPRERAFGFMVPRRLDGVRRWIKANKYFSQFGYPPCAD